MLFFGKKKKQVFQHIVDYVEGRLNVTQFQELLSADKHMQVILNEYAQERENCIYGKKIIEYIMKLRNSIFGKESLQEILISVLKKYKIKYNIYLKYKEDLSYMLDIQPSWMRGVNDQGIFDKILEEMPKDVSKTKQIAWGKARIKELFRYDKTYPRWIQDPEWPIVNGKPLVFSHQKRAGKDDVRTYYYFYDPDTKEETVITQMD